MPDLPLPFIAAPESSLLYTGIYDPVLVGLSIVVAVFAAYAALLVSRQVVAARDATTRRAWLGVGGLSLGLGIWAMHFVGMLALDLPCATEYDPGLTLVSILPSLAACVLFMRIASRPALTRPALWLGGLLLGGSTGAMHYMGMAALRIEGIVRYDPTVFLLSLAVAVALATLALWLKFRLQALPLPWGRWALPAGAAAIGLAVAVIHYTAMAAAYFLRDGFFGIVESQISHPLLAALVLTATSVLLLLTLVANYVAQPNLLSFAHSYKVVGLMTLGWCLVTWLGVEHYHARLIRDVYRQEQQSAEQALENLVRNLDDTLRDMKGIPQIFSKHPDILHALLRLQSSATPSPLPLAQRRQLWSEHPALLPLHHQLRAIATLLPIDVIWVMNQAGDTVAASNFDQMDSFVGSNFAKRLYFQQARRGLRGQQYGVGLISKTPGVFISYPVFDQERFLGAIVVKRNISNFANWIDQAGGMLTDANGVVVLAADRRDEFRTLPGAGALEMNESELRDWYNQRHFRPLHIEAVSDPLLPAAVRIDGSSTPSLFLSTPLPDGMLSAHIQRPLHDAVRLQAQQHWMFVLLAIAGSLLIVAASAIVLYMRQSQRTEADLRIAAAAFETQESMIIVDPQGIIQRINGAFTRMTGYTEAEAVGQPQTILRSGRHDLSYYQSLWDTVQRVGYWQGELWGRRKNGDIYPSWVNISAVKGRDGQITHYVGMHTDITQRKADEAEIRTLAFYDPLTQLPNRRLLLDRLRLALVSSVRSGKPGALLFIDLDNFKTLNDTLGHDQGDMLLREVAHRLTSSLREQDTVARLGGDEFVIMLEGLNAARELAATEARLICEKIIDVLNQPHQLANRPHHCSPSVGITLFGDAHDTIDEVLKRADLAMYQAKSAGRNTLRFFDPDMQAAVNARALLESDLREAIRQNQLLLHFQPQVCSDGRITGVEALLRWRHPQYGMVPPNEFVTLAEDTGLIHPLGQWVLETACAQLAVWSHDPRTEPWHLAVNVSARQFHHPDFASQVLAALDQSGADPHRLKLELTESLLLADVDDAIAKMRILKSRGIGFSLDDFGTGYSSLTYLKRLPLDELKIDRSFVRDIFTDANDAAIIRSIIALAHSLGLEVVAEGVEDEAQREFLLQQGCTNFQGYLFGRAVPACDLAAQPSVSTTGA